MRLRLLWLAAALALPAAAWAEVKAPRPGQSVGRYQLLTIKDQDGKELLVRMDRETGATWVLRHGAYPPAPKEPVHYWLTVPCARGDNLAPCAQR
ncbi:MAG TPA: hypothetical protein VFP70_07180 [Burkholderiales bacterium]|nr:hypothetical protein [Burkholderiales bacterium]